MTISPQPKERPILFSAPMVRAILEGRKTVTRREIKTRMRSADTSFELHQQPDGSWRPMHTFDESCMDDQGTEHPITCPYGKPGDRLWLRETTEIDEQTSDCVALSRYAADGAPVLYSGCEDPVFNGTVAHWDYPRRSRPSIHMQRWACRILLEITAVRVERLQDISEAQARAEGIDLDRLADGQAAYDMVADHNMTGRPTATGAFRDLWASINGIENWNANPWVWVVEFKQVTP
ncbi:hypothetical protein HX857_09820 [Pseudomonas gingeri]|nr:hypothetical protein [Pseudomonas gingeri]